MKFKESPICHKYLDGLKGIEIGGSAHNPFGLNTINIDYTDDMDTVFKQGEYELCKEKLKVDIVANGDNLPFKDEEWDFVISSHVIEHFFDPVKAIKEWLRVTKTGGYVAIICPLQKALPQETRPCTTLQEIINRHEGRMKPEEVLMEGGHQTSSVTGLPLHEHGHWSVWNLEDFLQICDYYKWNVIDKLAKDDKVGNGFFILLQK